MPHSRLGPSSSEEHDTKKCCVGHKTVEKWIVEYDCDLNMSVWLKFTLADREHVQSLRCAVCTQFKGKLDGMRNFRSAFIDGTTNVKTSMLKEHAVSDMHTFALMLFKKSTRCTCSVCEYALIAAAL